MTTKLEGEGGLVVGPLLEELFFAASLIGSRKKSGGYLLSVRFPSSSPFHIFLEKFYLSNRYINYG